VTRVFLSYAYPPYEAPRAVQVERMARYVSGAVEVLCGEVERISGPAASDPPVGSVTRVPWGRRARALRGVHGHLLRGRADVPDRYRPWAADAARALRRRSWHEGDVLVSFGQPWSDHLAALRFVRRRPVPWVAHFSDPWTKNPMGAVRPVLRPIDAWMERAVVQRADRLVFTNRETRELVMESFPARSRAKARVVAHAFEPHGEQPSPRLPGAPIVVRYLGAFYGRRSPAPLVAALAGLARERPAVLEGVRIELVGPSEVALHELPGAPQLPAGLLQMLPPVDYATSLELMRSADLLLVVDAPAERSPFLPSKLVEYVGSGRPIVALSPPGPAAALVGRLGGWVADPAGDVADAALADALDHVRRAEGDTWGDPDVRAEYRPERVAAALEAVMDEAVAAQRR
jgi:glycosyltransferase involved in cell wall biosynthesis